MFAEMHKGILTMTCKIIKYLVPGSRSPTAIQKQFENM